MRLKFGWIAAAGVAVLLGGCGSAQDKMERGVAIDREVATPESNKELEMPEAARQKAEAKQEEKKEERLFEESER